MLVVLPCGSVVTSLKVLRMRKAHKFTRVSLILPALLSLAELLFTLLMVALG